MVAADVCSSVLEIRWGQKSLVVEFQVDRRYSLCKVNREEEVARKECAV